eukprot:246037_1
MQYNHQLNPYQKIRVTNAWWIKAEHAGSFDEMIDCMSELQAKIQSKRFVVIEQDQDENNQQIQTNLISLILKWVHEKLDNNDRQSRNKYVYQFMSRVSTILTVFVRSFHITVLSIHKQKIIGLLKYHSFNCNKVVLELFIRLPFNLNSHEFKPYLLEILTQHTTHSSYEIFVNHAIRILNFIIDCAIYPHHMVTLFNDNDAIELMMKDFDKHNKNCCMTAIMTVTAKCILLVNAIYNDTSLNINHINPLIREKWEFMTDEHFNNNKFKNWIKKFLFDSQTKWNTYFDGVYDESTWYNSLKVGDKVDVEFVRSYWRFATIEKIIKLSNDPKIGKIFIVKYDDTMWNKQHYKVHVVNMITSITNNIRPFGFFAIFHASFHNTSIRHSYAYSGIPVHDSSEHCNYCDRECCTGCALHKIDCGIEVQISQSKSNIYICKDCSISRELKIIFDAIQSVFETKYAYMEMKTDIINLMAKFAMGYVFKCCNIRCRKIDPNIYCDNIWSFIKKWPDSYGSHIEYYELTEHNKLNLNYVYGIYKNKIRIFCSGNRHEPDGCIKKLTKCSFGDNYSERCKNKDIDPELIDEDSENVKYDNHKGLILNVHKNNIKELRRRRPRPKRANKSNSFVCGNHPVCSTCGNKKWVIQCASTNCTNFVCNGRIKSKCQCNGICMDCMHNQEQYELLSAVSHVLLSFMDANVINIIVEYSIGYNFDCCNENCDQIIFIKNKSKFRHYYDHKNNPIYYYVITSTDLSSSIKYESLDNYLIRIFCSKCVLQEEIFNKCSFKECTNGDVDTTCVNHPSCKFCGQKEKLIDCGSCKKKEYCYCCAYSTENEQFMKCAKCSGKHCKSCIVDKKCNAVNTPYMCCGGGRRRYPGMSVKMKCCGTKEWHTHLYNN